MVRSRETANEEQRVTMRRHGIVGVVGLGLSVVITTGAHAAQEPQDLLDQASGAVVISHSSQFNDDWAALLLLDDTAEHGWCSAQGAAFPHEMVVELNQLTDLTSIAFDNSGVQEGAYPGISARAIEVWASAVGPDAGFTKVLEVEAERGARSVFSFLETVKAGWVKLVITSNWGHASFTELMEVDAFGEPSGPAPMPPALAGVYRTNYGLMLFAQQGPATTGCYDWDQGTLTGSTEGRVVQFEWREEGDQIGTAVMVLSLAGDRLNGLWYENGRYGGLWVGSRAPSGERPTCTLRTGTVAHSLEEGGRAIVYGIRFDEDSDRLRTESDATLREILSVLESQPDLNLIVEGHTDATGDDAYNQDLSQRRAQAVVQWLVGRGIGAPRLQSMGHGEAQPVANNETAQGRALNRRVELRRSME
jgi:outer membrane protein OmpA-like peptidoglycan-associated protein